MISKDIYEELSRKSACCQDDLTQALEKVGYTLSSPKRCVLSHFSHV